MLAITGEVPILPDSPSVSVVHTEVFILGSFWAHAVH